MMTRIQTLALTAALLVTGAAAPAAADREHQQIMADIRMLQEQTQQLQAMLGALTSALTLVTSKLDEQAGVNRKAFADQKLLVDTLAGDVRILREKVDDGNVRIASLGQELEALRIAIPPSPVMSFPPPDGAIPGAAADPSAPLPTAPVGPGQSPQRLFDQAQADYAAGQWTLAIQGFEVYLKNYPRSPLAAEAQLNIGRSFLADQRFAEAVEAFDQVIANYQESDAVAVAFYYRGNAFERLGQLDRARESYETVINRFPNASSTILAKQALIRVNRSGR